MSAREVLAGLRAAEQGCYPRWHDGQALCPLCKDDGSCALNAAIQWFEDHVGAEDIRAKAEASLAPVTKAIDEAVANAVRLLGRKAVLADDGATIRVDGIDGIVDGNYVVVRSNYAQGFGTTLDLRKVEK